MLKKHKECLTKGLQSVDIFEEPIRLNMQGDESLKSSIGGILTLIIVIFLLVQVIIQVLAITDRKNPTVVQMSEYDSEPDRVDLNRSNNFIFAVTVSVADQAINMSNNSPVSFTSTYSQQLRSSDGSLRKNKAKIYWSSCTQANFPTDVFPADTFSTYSLKYAYCPYEIDYTNSSGLCPEDIIPISTNCKTPIDLSLEGNFLSMDFQYLQFQLNLCNSADATTVKGLTCATGDPKTVFNTSEVKFNLYYSNNVIDPVNYDTPNKTYIDTIYWNLSPYVSQFADIYIDTITVQDFSDFIRENVYRNRTFYQISNGKLRDMQAFKQTSLLKLNLRRSNLNLVTIRKYFKILDVISNIGGISKVLVVIAAIFAIAYTRFKSQVILSNNLYDFDLPRSNKIKRSISKKHPKAKNQKQDTSQKFKTLSPKNFNKKPTITTQDSVKSYFESRKKESRALRYGETEYLKGFLNKLLCRRSVEEKLAEKARNQIIRDLDIVKIVGKLKEIDKLKKLILNEEQREAFDFIEKPRITLKDEEPVEHKSLVSLDDPDFPETPKNDQGLFETRDQYTSISKYSKLYEAYTRLKQDSDPRNWKYNKKLLNLMGKDVKEIFQKIDKIMEGETNPKKFEEVVEKIMNAENVPIGSKDAVELKSSGTMLELGESPKI